MVSETVSFGAAFGAGFASFISPCVLPLVPVYLTSMTGLSVDELSRAEGKPWLRVLTTGLAFCLGLSLVFILLGITATSIGSFLADHQRALSTIFGIMIIIFGLHMTGILKIAFLYRVFQIQTSATPASARRGGFAGFLRPFSMGAAFAFGWTPCVGPILGAVLAYAATRETVAQGALLLAVYSLGLCIPFLFAALAFSKFATSYKKFRNHLHTVEVVSGTLLILFGVLLATNSFTVLTSWLSRVLLTP